MASKKSTAAAKKDVASPPVLLTQGQRRRYALGMVFALVVFAIGSLGLLVLLDQEEKKHWYAHTQFATYWRKLTEINPMVTAVAFNGGGIYSFILFARLRADNRARKASKTGKKKV
ncbi:hypothetical protein Ndes2526B_g01763 [Nannochloris sp. 'desiccata']|nr:hypothetical protein KSW81_005754 [Chlorella desiccata (nom. nud.)]KAH7623337.1 hypothetical protein NADE_002527 [Chlorella desiccata (nom. nud.)]